MLKSVYHSFFKKFKDANFTVRYWDGETMGYGPGEPKVSILLHKPLPVDFGSGNLIVAFGEAYMESLVDFEGSMEEIIRIVEKNKENIAGGITGKLVSAINSMANSRSRQKQNIQHHYDLGNDFFALWLDETMSYSCAYFKSPDDSLYQAQLQKIHHTLKKLQLKPGERLLDIGCGWGWLIIKAALNYRVRAMGITLSEEQYRAVKDKIMEYNLGHLVEVKLANYLDLAEEDYRFEKIVSVGMFEHVGRENLGKYMEGTMLSPGGLSLLHSIMGTDEHPPNQWIDKYIFPGGYIPSLRETLGLFPEYNFHLLHAESLRLHYALTLDRWYDNFKKHIPAVREKFDEKFIRMWGLYLASCAASFRVSGLDIYQLLFSKGLNNELPLTLDYIYE